MAEAVQQAVVALYDNPTSDDPSGFLGSGVFIAPRVVLTAKHIFEDRDHRQVWVRPYNGRAQRVQVEPVPHQELDAAWFRVEHMPRSASVLRMNRGGAYTSRTRLSLTGYFEGRLEQEPGKAITSFDPSERRYLTTPAHAKGMSGGALCKGEDLWGISVARYRDDPRGCVIAVHQLWDGFLDRVEGVRAGVVKSNEASRGRRPGVADNKVGTAKTVPAPEATATIPARERVFISYSHSDETWRKAIAQQLGVLEQQGLIDVWDDRRIGAGQDWYGLIDENMSSAKVALLLVSAAFLTSDFILREELPRLFAAHSARGMTVYPLLIRPCAWEEVSWLARLQMRPADAKAVAQFKGSAREVELAKVAREIGRLCRAESVSDVSTAKATRSVTSPKVAASAADASPPASGPADDAKTASRTSRRQDEPVRTPSAKANAVLASSGTTTAARRQFQQALEDARIGSNSSVEHVLAGCRPPIDSLDAAVQALEPGRALEVLARVHEAVHATYVKPGARAVLDEPAEQVIVALAFLCLESRVRERLGERSGGPSLPVDADNRPLHLVVGALWCDAGLVLDGSALHASPLNVLTDSAPVQLGHLTLEDALGAEALARAREQLFGADREHTLRDAAIAKIDPAEVRVHTDLYRQRKGGARLIAAIDVARLPQGKLDAALARNLETRFGLSAFATEVSSAPATRDVALEVRRQLETLSNLLDLARKTRGPAPHR